MIIIKGLIIIKVIDVMIEVLTQDFVKLAFYNYE